MFQAGRRRDRLGRRMRPHRMHVGAAGAGAVVDRIGLKKGLVCFALSSLGMWFAASLNQFVIWRLIGGSELALPPSSPDVHRRNRARPAARPARHFVSTRNCARHPGRGIRQHAHSTHGRRSLEHSVGWRWMFLVGVVPALLFGLTILPAVESPRWLMKMGRPEDALSVLSKINEPDDRSNRSQADSGLAGSRGRPYLGAIHHLPASPADWNHAGGILAAKRHHAAVFFSSGNLQVGRNRHQ